MKAQDFAEWIGRTRQMLARWETRADRVDRFTLWGIAGATGANYFYLLEGRGEPFGKDPRALRIASPTKV
jgi:transcriptional regulator with XRE-family HTH domain